VLSEKATLAEIRLRYPGIDDREAMLRLAAMSIDREMMVRAFGWDPEHSASQFAMATKRIAKEGASRILLVPPAVSRHSRLG
jgi:hypothetical protein